MSDQAQQGADQAQENADQAQQAGEQAQENADQAQQAGEQAQSGSLARVGRITEQLEPGLRIR
jgi:hypothetical protein